MTFWHYHWALLRARELKLRPAIAWPFAHMAQLATPAGACAYSIDSMAADLGINRSNFSRAVLELWKLGAIWSAGLDPSRDRKSGRVARIYRLVDELEARAAVEADRAARRQPLPPATVQPQPLPPATVQPLPPATIHAEQSPGEPAYKPRLRSAPATVAPSHGSTVQPLPPATQPLPPATHYKSTIMNHESDRPLQPKESRPQDRAKPKADSWKDWRARLASP